MATSSPRGIKRAAPGGPLSSHTVVVLPRSGITSKQQELYESRARHHGATVLALSALKAESSADSLLTSLVLLVGAEATLASATAALTTRGYSASAVASAIASGTIVVVRSTWLEKVLEAGHMIPFGIWQLHDDTSAFLADATVISSPTAKKLYTAQVASTVAEAQTLASTPYNSPGAPPPKWWDFPIAPFGRGVVQMPRSWFVTAPSATAANEQVGLQPLNKTSMAAGTWHCTSDDVWRTTPLLCMLAAGEGITASALNALASRTASNANVSKRTAASRAAFLQLTAAALGEIHWFESASGPSASAAVTASPDAGQWPYERLPTVAAFDLDGTLIHPTNGAKFCSASDDWVPAHSAAFATLRALAARGCQVVILSNQSGPRAGKSTVDIVRARVAAVVKAIAAPGLVAFVATAHDWARKPCPGMWWFANIYLALKRQQQGQSWSPDPANCVFVGDAAGRPKRPNGTKDFSAGDIRFALNAGLRFATPEAFFALPKPTTVSAAASCAPRTAFDLMKRSGSVGGGAATAAAPSALDLAPHTGGDDGWCGRWVPARDLAQVGSARIVSRCRQQRSNGSADPAGAAASAADVLPVDSLARGDDVQEVVLLVGLPGSGKSSLALGRDFNAETYRSVDGGAVDAAAALRARYIRINQDLLGTRARCITAARAVLKSGASVIVDATNLDAGARTEWLAVARDAGISARAIHVDEPVALSLHLAALRAAHPLGGPDGAADHRDVPAVVIYTAAKKLAEGTYTPPGVAEGFEEVIRVRFVPYGPEQLQVTLTVPTSHATVSSAPGGAAPAVVAAELSAGGSAGAGDEKLQRLAALTARDADEFAQSVTFTFVNA